MLKRTIHSDSHTYHTLEPDASQLGAGGGDCLGWHVDHEYGSFGFLAATSGNGRVEINARSSARKMFLGEW